MAKRTRRTAGKSPEEQELEQLAAAPLLNLSGIVYGDVGGWKAPGEKAWTALLRLKPWRVRGGEIQESTLFARKRSLTQRDLDRHMRAIKPFTVRKARARVVEKSAMARPAALVTRFAGTERADADLGRRAIELRKPVTEKDERFGRLTLDRRPGVYTTKAKWNGRPVELELEAQEPEGLQAALKTARAL